MEWRQTSDKRRQRQRLAQTDSYRQPLLIEFKSSDLLTPLDHCDVITILTFRKVVRSKGSATPSRGRGGVLQLPPPKQGGGRHQRESCGAETMRRCLPNITGWAGIWAWPLVQIQSLFSRKPSRKKKMWVLFPLKMSSLKMLKPKPKPSFGFVKNQAKRKPSFRP